MEKTSGSTGKKERIFKIGKYYVADEDNYCAEFNSYSEAKKYAMEDEVILICVSPVSVTKPSTTSKVIPFKPTKADKIVINFDKNVLTVIGKDVTIGKVDFKVGDTKLPDKYNWESLLSSSASVATSVEIVGKPPLEPDEEDITDEMSDL